MDFNQIKAKGSDLLGQAMEKAGPLAAQAKEKAGPLAEKAKDVAAKGVDKAADGIDSATGGKYKDKIGTVTDKLGSSRNDDVNGLPTATDLPPGATTPDAPTLVEVGDVTETDPTSPWPAATSADLPAATVLDDAPEPRS